MKWYIYLTNNNGNKFPLNYYGYKTKKLALESFEKAQKLVDKGQLLKVEIVKK